MCESVLFQNYSSVWTIKRKYFSFIARKDMVEMTSWALPLRVNWLLWKKDKKRFENDPAAKFGQVLGFIPPTRSKECIIPSKNCEQVPQVVFKR